VRGDGGGYDEEAVAAIPYTAVENRRGVPGRGMRARGLTVRAWVHGRAMMGQPS